MARQHHAALEQSQRFLEADFAAFHLFHQGFEFCQRSLEIGLLTDGVVDVSKDDSRNKASRERVLTELLPELQQRGIKVLTVALSDAADNELLETLALATDAQSVAQLREAFQVSGDAGKDIAAVRLLFS